MPINQSLMRNLVKNYGKKDGTRIYNAMENEGAKATKKAAIKRSIKDHPSYYKKKKK